MRKFNEKLFKAFFIYKTEEEYKGFNTIELNSEYSLFISKDYEYYKEQTGKLELLLLGYCLDIRDSSLSSEEIANMLSEKDSIDEIYEELEFINGRFTIIIQDGANIYISSDAISLKPIFYSETVDVISSHEYIIIEIAREKEISLKLNSAYRRGFLDLTTYNDIYKLSCSNELMLPGYRQRRLFPLDNRKEQPYEKAIESLIPCFDNMTEWLNKCPKNIVFSMTGGIDSRTSLAILKPIINNVKSFTYLRPKKDLKNKAVKEIYTNDEKIVKSIVDNLNINHEFFYFERIKQDQEYYDYIQKISSSNHSFPLSKYLYDNQEYKDSLHVKSTLQAIAKTTYPLELYNLNNYSSMVRGTLHWGSEKLIKSSKNDIETVYSAYLDRVKLQLDDLKGYNILDMMYLDGRLGHFQSIITQETDNTLEVFNFVNTRYFFRVLYSVPLLDRHERKTHKEIVQHYWPVLNQFGVNTNEVFITSTEVDSTLDKFNNELINELEFIKTNNLALTKNKGVIQIKPKQSPLLSKKQYMVSLVNNADYNTKLTISSTYTNVNGRENIKLIINGIEYDILDLNKPLNIILKSNDRCHIEYKFKNDKKNDSWLNAAKLILKMSTL